MRTEGFARATTKHIARAAGYSEAALYKHFADKLENFLGVLRERLPGLSDALAELTAKANTSTPQADLARVARYALDFYIESFPIATSLFSEQELLVVHRERLRQLGTGPHHAANQLERYLRTQRRLGRIRRTVEVKATASLLLGSCFPQAFLINLAGERPGDACR